MAHSFPVLIKLFFTKPLNGLDSYEQLDQKCGRKSWLTTLVLVLTSFLAAAIDTRMYHEATQTDEVSFTAKAQFSPLINQFMKSP